MTDRKRQFNGSSTCEQVLKDIDLSGKTIAITGTTNGIGIETARSLALAGAHVICLNRNEKLTKEAIEKVKSEKPTVEMSFIKCDLSSLASVQAAAEQLIKTHEKLHVLILNAGMYSTTQRATADGLESTFGVNHVGHFHLTALLLPLLKASAPSRIVVVSSDGHIRTGINPTSSLEEKVSALIPAVEEDIGVKRGIKLYCLSKLCNVLFAKKLHRNLEEADVDVYVLHPGMIMDIGVLQSMGFLGKIIRLFGAPFDKSISQGAATTVYCAVHPETKGISGKYWVDCWDDEKCLKRVFSEDVDLQDELWKRTEHIIDEIEKRSV